MLFIFDFVSDPESESESEPESESIKIPESESESESERPHHDSAPLISDHRCLQLSRGTNLSINGEGISEHE